MSAYTRHQGLFVGIGGIRYRTTAAIDWERGEKGSGWWFHVPAGTAFDVSVPLLLRWAASPHDARFLKAAALHDAMLAAGVDRLRAAAEFNLALKADGVGRARRLAMTAAVAFWRFE